MIRVVFINLQNNGFYLKTEKARLLRQTGGSKGKHRFILDYLLSRDDIQVCNLLLEEMGATLMPESISRTTPVSLVRREWIECCRHNGVDYKKIRLIYDTDDLNENDVIIYYMFYHYQFNYGIESRAKKAVSLIHFFGEKEEADLLRKVNPDILFSEGRPDLYSKLFKKNFSWYKGKILQIMFTPAERFKAKKKFAERKNKAVAVGTITKRQTEEFIEAFGSDCYQPLRKQIRDNAGDLSDVLDSVMSDYVEKEVKKPEGRNIFKKIAWRIQLTLNSGKQTSYFSFDMVDKYNDYRMCIVPEDIHGYPGIGFIEGMACGCAYIGWDKIDYSVYGMIPGEHYITYDGTLEDLRRVIRYYQEHDEELRRIAKKGYELIRERVTEENAAEELVKLLIQ